MVNRSSREIENMTLTTSQDLTPELMGRSLTERALSLALRGTTDMAPSVLPVPLSYYGDEEQLQREIAILRSVPLVVVPSAQVAAPNDFVVRQVLDTSLLVTRDGDGATHVFLNYCRHRGARPAEGCGNTRRHTCPYHAWTYDAAGTLVGLPGQEAFDIDTAAYGLVELPNEERHGFVWASLTSGGTIDVATHLGPLDAELERLGYGDFGYLTEREFTSHVSWKGALEAFAEGYHFPYVHGQSVIGQNTLSNTSTHDAFGLHHRMGFPFNWITLLDADPHGSWEPIDNMGVIYWIYPNLVLANSPVGVEIIDILPGSTPTSCSVRHSWMGRVPATTDEERATYEAIYDTVHAAVRDEDFAMLPQCGDGVRHGQHDHMVIGRNEIGVQHMVRTFASQLGLDLG
jgi:phenylpropionate dioxygenase-like ring-hydroxylating dioxygenase large terminal subunit